MNEIVAFFPFPLAACENKIDQYKPQVKRKCLRQKIISDMLT